MKYSWVHSIGIRDSKWVPKDERESEDEIDNRGEDGVKASVRLGNWRKSSCFRFSTQSEIEPANQRNTGSWTNAGFIHSETKSSSFSLDAFAFLPSWSF